MLVRITTKQQRLWLKAEATWRRSRSGSRWSDRKELNSTFHAIPSLDLTSISSHLEPILYNFSRPHPGSQHGSESKQKRLDQPSVRKGSNPELTSSQILILALPHRGYDLASLRPGGATHLLNITEDAELVKRRGRWATTKVMNIYLQEIAVATGLEKLTPETRSKVDRLCAIFPLVLQQVLQYLKFNIPCTAWPMLFRHHQRPGKWWGSMVWQPDIGCNRYNPSWLKMEWLQLGT